METTEFEQRKRQINAKLNFHAIKFIFHVLPDLAPRADRAGRTGRAGGAGGAGGVARAQGRQGRAEQAGRNLFYKSLCFMFWYFELACPAFHPCRQGRQCRQGSQGSQGRQVGQAGQAGQAGRACRTGRAGRAGAHNKTCLNIFYICNMEVWQHTETFIMYVMLISDYMKCPRPRIIFVLHYMLPFSKYFFM